MIIKQSSTSKFSGLASINMPALIEDETKHERLPASIIKKCEDLRSKGGFHVLENREKELNQASSATLDRIGQVCASI